MHESREGTPSPEENGIQNESKEKYQELQEMGAILQHIPSTHKQFEWALEDSFRQYTKENYGDQYRAEQGRDLYNSVKGGPTDDPNFEYYVTPNRGTFLIRPEQRQEAEAVYEKIREEAARFTIEDMKTQAFIAKEDPIRSKALCPACKTEITKGGRYIYRNLRQNPIQFIPTEYGPEIDHKTTKDWAWPPDSDFIRVPYMQLHNLTEHPEKASVPTKEWQDFLTSDDQEFFQRAVLRRLRAEIANKIIERIQQKPQDFFPDYFNKQEMNAATELAIKEGSEMSGGFGSGAVLEAKSLAEEIVEKRLGKNARGYEERGTANSYWMSPVE